MTTAGQAPHGPQEFDPLPWITIPIAVALAVAVYWWAMGMPSFERAEITDCEQGVISKLKAPSTYKRINISRYFDNASPPKVRVSIEYDANNTYNTPLRDTETCEYPAEKDGSVDMEKYSAERAKTDLAEASAAAESATQAAAEASQAATEAAAAAEKVLHPAAARPQSHASQEAVEDVPDCEGDPNCVAATPAAEKPPED